MEDRNSGAGGIEEKANYDFLLIQYQVLSNRELNHDTMMWNTPSLLFVCQTLLWGSSLDDSVNLIFRCLVSFVSVLIGFASYQLFLRHRLMVITDAEQLYSIEKFLSNNIKKKPNAITVFHRLDQRTVISGNHLKKIVDVLRANPVYAKNPMSHFPSFRIWEFTFFVLIILSIAIFGYNVYLAIASMSL